MADERTERIAGRMLDKAEEGNSFSREYNNLSPADQRSVFQAMKNLQSKGNYANVELVDSDRDGFLDDAKVTRDGKTRDVYDTPEQDRAKQYAQRLLTGAASGRDMSGIYNGLSENDQKAVFAAMKQLKDEHPEKFGNIQLIDKDNNGTLDDARAQVASRNARGQTESVDVYDTPADAQAKAVQQKVIDGVTRQLPGIIYDTKRGKPGRAGERIEDEVERGVIDILRGGNKRKP